jgi:hypothetical protein
VSQNKASGMCRDAMEGRFFWNREGGNGCPSPEAFCCSNRRKGGVIMPRRPKGWSLVRGRSLAENA